MCSTTCTNLWYKHVDEVRLLFTTCTIQCVRLDPRNITYNLVISLRVLLYIHVYTDTIRGEEERNQEDQYI